MANINISNQPDLVMSHVQQRQETYYLLTIDKINSIKSKSSFSDLFIGLSSLLWGAYLSCMTTVSSLPTPKEPTDPMNLVTAKLEMMNVFFLAGAVIFTLLAIWTFWLSYKEMKELTSNNVVVGNAPSNTTP